MALSKNLIDEYKSAKNYFSDLKKNGYSLTENVIANDYSELYTRLLLFINTHFFR